MMIASVSGSSWNRSIAVDKVRADDRIAADADARGLADAARRQLVDRLVGQRAGAGDDADVALLVDVPGMMPILHLPGEMMPGQFGPISRECLRLEEAPTRTMSSAGMPSVMQTMSGMPGVGRFHDGVGRGRRRNEDHRGVGAGLLDRFATVLKIGQPSCVVPPLPGVTPPTTLVP